MKLRFFEHQVVRFLQERRYLGEQLSTSARQQLQQRHLQPFLKKIVAGLVVVAMLMAVMGASLYRDTTSLIQTSQQVIHTQNFIQELEILLSKLTDAEIGQRGYIITGKENYLQPYYVAVKQIEREVTILRESVADDPNQQQRLNTLESLLVSKLTELKTTINLRRHQGVEAALQVVQTARGKNLMDAVREVIHQMESIENNLLRQCLLSLEANAKYTIFTLSTGIILTFLLFLGICYLIYQEAFERHRAEEQVSLLQRLLVTVAETQDIDAALALILGQVCETQGWNYAEAWIPCPDKKVLMCSPVWYHHVDDRELSRIEKFRKVSEEQTFASGVGLPGRVWLAKLPEWQKDVSRVAEATFQRSGIARETGLRTAIGIPLLVKEEVLAILVFFKFESCREDRRLLGSMSIIAAQLGALVLRKQLDQKLYESEKRFQAFMDNSPAVTFIKNEEGRYTYVNKMLERLFSVERAELLGKTDFDWLPQETANQIRQNDLAVLATDGTTELLETVPTSNGRSHSWLIYKFTMRDTSGKRFLGGVAIDITQRQQAEEALRHLKEELELRVTERTRELSVANSTLWRQIHEREQVEEKLQRSEEQFRVVFNQAAVGIAQVALDGKWLLVNQKLCDIVGYSPEALVERNFQDIIHLDDSEADLDYVYQLLAGKIQTYSMEKRYICKDGAYVWINLTVSLVREPLGKPKHFISVIEDIQERKLAEEKLRQSEQRYRFLADAMPQIVWTARPDGYLDYYNNRWYELTGFAKGEAGDDSWKQILHPDDIEVYFNRWESSVRTGVAYKLEYRLFDCKTGSYRWHLGQALPMRNENGDIIQWIGNITDINDQRLALEELAIAHQQLDLKVQERTAELVEEVNERIHIEEQLQASLQEKELLLKEIHHRVKNNLQIVSGLLYLQSRYINDLPTLTALQENRDRIQSMALIHEKLYGSKNFERIDFKDYTQSLIQNLYISQSVNTNLISFKVDIEPLYLGIDTAIHCGLIINELVSNSLKHAFPSGLSGEITVQFYTTKERNFELIVRDNGIGFAKQPDFQQQKSLGLRLVHALATKQLEGTLELTKGKAESVTPESNSGCVFRTSPKATSGWKGAEPLSKSIVSPGAEFRICFSV